VRLFLALELAYLLGSVPFVGLIERISGSDLGSAGTGNRGAGNATRIAGPVAGASLAILDGLKGLIPVMVVSRLGFSQIEIAFTALAAVAGNNWPVWRVDRGGRGLAASAGAALGGWPALMIWPGLWSVVGWKVGGGLGGFLGWGLLPVYAVAVGASVPAVVLAFGLSGFMLVRRAQGNAGFTPSGAAGRMIRDLDRRATTDPERPLAIGAAGAWAAAVLIVGLPGYVWLTRSFSIEPDLGWYGGALLAAAAATELGAKFVFAELFREGTGVEGTPVSRRGAVRAALVGTGVARLIPIGGAVTPIAMAWAVRDERGGTTGAAVRATVLNYGGLVIATGVGLLWATISHPPLHARGTVGVAGVGLVLGGIGLVGFGTRMRILLPLLPRRFRDRAGSSLVDHAMNGRTWMLLVARVLLEAATLGLTLEAFGRALPPSQVVAAFAGSQLVGGLPGTPGGLGVTEAGLVGFLVYFGVPAAVAAGPVLVFRIISYWLPAIGGIAAGGNAFLRQHSRPAT
jgi:glycerol-3-phosphate acyltransferase PlsY